MIARRFAGCSTVVEASPSARATAANGPNLRLCGCNMTRNRGLKHEGQAQDADPETGEQNRHTSGA